MATNLLTAAATDARIAINGMLESLHYAADDLGYDYVALLLDIDEQTLRRRLDGTDDMTLAQVRQLAIATGITLRIETVATELVH